MKEQQVKDLFQNADTMKDYRMIFALNPNLEDEILEIGKEKGIVLPVDKELSEMELNMVVGGLGLKQGVMFTLATLMATSSIAGPACQVVKQATTRNETGIQVIYNVAQTQKSDKKRETTAKKALTKEIATAQTQTQAQEQATKNTTETKTTTQSETTSNQATADKEKVKKGILGEDDPAVCDLNNNEEAIKEEAKEEEKTETPASKTENKITTKELEALGLTTDAIKDFLTSEDQTDAADTDTTNDTSALCEDGTNFQREGEHVDEKEYVEKKKKASAKNYWTEAENKMELFTKAFFKQWSEVLGKYFLGPGWYGVMKDAFTIFSDYDKLGMTGKKSDPNAPVLAMITDVINTIYKSTAEIINQDNKNAFKIVSVLEDDFIDADKKIEAVNLNAAIQKFTSTLQSFLKTFSVNEDVVKHISNLSTSDSEESYSYLKQNYNTITNSFKSIYTTTNGKEKRDLVEIFDYISSALSGQDAYGNAMAVVNGQSIGMFEIYKQAVSANKSYVFDNQSVSECEAFLKDTLKKYVAAYSMILFLTEYEVNNIQKKMMKAFYERIEKAGELNDELSAMLKNDKTKTDPSIYDKYLKYLLDGDKNAPIEQQGVIARYGSQLTRAEIDLNNLKKSFQNGLNAIKAEAARLAYIKQNPDVYFNGESAYMIDHVITPNDYTFNSGQRMLDNGNAGLTKKELHDDIYYGYHVDNKIEINPQDERLTSDSDFFRWACEDYNEWKDKLKKQLEKESNSTFVKESKIALSNSEISALCKHYLQYVASNDGFKFDGIYMGTEDFKISSLSKFHKEVFQYYFWWHEVTLGYDIEQGVKLTKTFKYLDAIDTKQLKETSITLNLNFWNKYDKAASDTKTDMTFAVLADVTQNYVEGIQKAISDALMLE